MSKNIPVAIILLLVLVGSGWADISSTRSQLEQLKARIDQAETDLQNKKQSELNISRELALLRKVQERAGRRVSELKTRQKKLLAEMKQQKKRIKDSQKGLKKIGLRLERRLVALYKEGEMGPLKVLFSADSPIEMAQHFHYLTRVLQYDKDLLYEYRQAMQIQQQHLTELESLQQQQTVSLEKERQQQQVAAKAHRLQARLLKQAQIDKQKMASELVLLQERAVRLSGLIDRLEKKTASTAGSAVNSFASGRGQLGWPVNGQVMIGFGQQKDVNLGTYYESNGIEIAIPPGSPIRAVASGKVVFADYFKGYGNLFILSHPGGFHTLYAQVGRLEKVLGAEVTAGDLLGYSGLAGRDSIYFEIRLNGSPVNPLAWLIRR